MEQEEQSTKAAKEQLEEIEPLRDRLRNDFTIWTCIGAVIPILTTLLVFLIFRPFHNSPDVVRRLSSFMIGLLSLEMSIVAIGIFVRHKNRDVFLLGRQLAEIYLSALRNSALNPKLGSSTSND